MYEYMYTHIYIIIYTNNYRYIYNHITRYIYIYKYIIHFFLVAPAAKQRCLKSVLIKLTDSNSPNPSKLQLCTVN